jgi:glucokinase
VKVKRWIASLDGWPEKKVSQVEVVRATDYDRLERALQRIVERTQKASIQRAAVDACKIATDALSGASDNGNG